MHGVLGVLLTLHFAAGVPQTGEPQDKAGITGACVQCTWNHPAHTGSGGSSAEGATVIPVACKAIVEHGTGFALRHGALYANSMLEYGSCMLCRSSTLSRLCVVYHRSATQLQVEGLFSILTQLLPSVLL